jgi:6-phosphogluconate dehydrogenase (decarboxylating)
MKIGIIGLGRMGGNIAQDAKRFFGKLGLA